MLFIDVGANLTHDSFDNDRDAVLQRAHDAGVTQMIVTGASRAGSEAALKLARARPNMLHATAGVHPHHAKDYSDETHATLEALADKSEVVAIGETGLDFYRDLSPRPVQEAVFERQLELAATSNKPVFLHQRDAHARFLPLLKTYRDQLSNAVVHCFTGTKAELHAYLDLDCHIGITGWICDERRGEELKNIVGGIPADRLMLETDAPYLLPRDLDPKPDTRRNEPMYLPHIAAAVARARGEKLEALAQDTTRTARAFFALG